MFRFFESLVDPYQPCAEADALPRRLWPFRRGYVLPVRKVFVVTGLVSVIMASADIGLIWYDGALVDLLTVGEPAQGLAQHGGAFLTAALLVVVLRPPVPWFAGDFAGRIANRIMAMPPAAGDAVFQTFEAMSFGLITVTGAGVLLDNADPRLLVPLGIWFTLHALLVRWTIRHAGPASEASADATGRMVDACTTIHAGKRFAHHDREIADARAAIETARQSGGFIGTEAAE